MTAQTDPTGADGRATTNFVSYYSRTDRQQAVPVIEALEPAGYAVCWDGLLEGGDRFLQTAEIALESARALSMQAKLVLVDEPTGNLDSQSADNVFNLMR
jgi:ABC-type phosphate/phosphonate transport system ATPase subunit